uniref:Uncharacterized protein n=1 Tax=Microplitis mediator bracovirus TaxID=1836595 RepID=A0A1D5APF8_9VIRU|nr:hypothetical protein A6F54_26 [Microplitis mediator bracovirus]
MEEHYTAILYEKLGTFVWVPNEWPARIEILLLALAERIIDHYNYVSPIIQINNVPTKLTRRTDTAGFYYVFEKVSHEEIFGAYIYNVEVPKNGESIKIEINSGRNFGSDTRPSNTTDFLPDVARVSPRPTFPKSCWGALSSGGSDSNILRRRLLRSTKR